MNNLKKYAGLLNNAAPKGEFLAYINEEEAEILKDNGALGLLTPQGIPSYRRSNYDGSGGGLAGSSNDPGRSANRGDNDGSGRNNPFEQQARQRAAKVAADQKAARDRENAKTRAAEKARAIAAEKARAIAAEKDRQKRVREAEAAAKARAVAEEKRQDDARLDYITGKYLDVTLDDKQKKEFEQYRTGVRKSINPSQKLSNKIVGGLLNTILPGSGMLYNFYLDSTAMGYKMQNPFGNLFGGGGEISLDDVNNLRGGDNGSDSNARSQLVQSITQAINPNLPTSQVDNYFKNIGSKGLGVSPAYMNTYNQAKDQMAKSLNLTPNNQQFGYTANPYPNYSMSMTSANPFFDELTNQGLI